MRKGQTDNQRLMRAFKVPATNKKLSVIGGAGLGALGVVAAPVLFIPAAGFIAALGVFEITDRRAITKGLRELEHWDIPLTGYREWLLAEEPAFEVELRRNADMHVIATSTRAIDPGIRVRRIGEREVRFVTPRVALPGLQDGDLPTYLGDRRLLFEIHARILAPLHADVGIARIRMGERTSLETRPSEPVDLLDDGTPAIEGMGAFRDQAMAAPPALQALVHGGSTLALAADSRSRSFRTERVLYATGRTPHGVGAALAIALGIGCSGSGLGLIGMGIASLIGLPIGISVIFGNNKRNAKRADAHLGNEFPLEDYDAWLISGRPLFDIELASDVDRTLLAARLRTIEAFSGEANAPVKWVEDVTWIDDRVVRVETRPTLVTPSTGKIRPFYGGSHVLFRRLVTEVLIPLHRESGIVTVRMGGYNDRRV